MHCIQPDPSDGVAAPSEVLTKTLSETSQISAYLTIHEVCFPLVFKHIIKIRHLKSSYRIHYSFIASKLSKYRQTTSGFVNKAITEKNLSDEGGSGQNNSSYIQSILMGLLEDLVKMFLHTLADSLFSITTLLFYTDIIYQRMPIRSEKDHIRGALQNPSEVTQLRFAPSVGCEFPPCVYNLSRMSLLKVAYGLHCTVDLLIIYYQTYPVLFIRDRIV